VRAHTGEMEPEQFKLAAHSLEGPDVKGKGAPRCRGLLSNGAIRGVYAAYSYITLYRI